MRLHVFALCFVRGKFSNISTSSLVDTAGYKSLVDIQYKLNDFLCFYIRRILSRELTGIIDQRPEPLVLFMIEKEKILRIKVTTIRRKSVIF